MSDDKKEVGRRETLQLAALTAALGAGLAVSFHASEADADGNPQLQLKFYRSQQKGEPQLVHAITLPDDVTKKLAEIDPAQVQIKWYGTQKEAPLLGASQVQWKLDQLKVPATRLKP